MAIKGTENKGQTLSRCVTLGDPLHPHQLELTFYPFPRSLAPNTHLTRFAPPVLMADIPATVPPHP